mmetsp:Transcript_5421/g.12420  ORF Transcript_5421/g.12420 Transcript_5421/m.12420 type:complete len:321 (+) Transcript_5421:129-1091(+)
MRMSRSLSPALIVGLARSSASAAAAAGFFTGLPWTSNPVATFCSTPDTSSRFCSSYRIMQFLVISMWREYLETSSLYWGIALIASAICPSPCTSFFTIPAALLFCRNVLKRLRTESMASAMWRCRSAGKIGSSSLSNTSFTSWSPLALVYLYLYLSSLISSRSCAIAWYVYSCMSGEVTSLARSSTRSVPPSPCSFHHRFCGGWLRAACCSSRSRLSSTSLAMRSATSMLPATASLKRIIGRYPRVTKTVARRLATRAMASLRISGSPLVPNSSWNASAMSSENTCDSTARNSRLNSLRVFSRDARPGACLSGKRAVSDA